MLVQDLLMIRRDPHGVRGYCGKIKPEFSALLETVESLTAKTNTGIILTILEGLQLIARVCTGRKGEALYLDRLAGSLRLSGARPGLA